MFFHRILSYVLTLNDQKESFLLIKSIIVERLDLESCKSHTEREDKLKSFFHDSYILEKLPLLNNLLNLQVTA